MVETCGMALWTFYRVPKHISWSNSKFQTQLPTADPITLWSDTPYEHRAFLNQLFKTNPTQPELAFYLIGKVWFTFFIFSRASQSEGWISKFWPLIGSRGKND